MTRDLASFWATGYKAVKAELKGRYPRHYWPDDPLIAEPTARVAIPGRAERLLLLDDAASGGALPASGTA